MTTNRPRLLIISAVKPYPLNSGQQVRVYNKLLALRPHFHITFLTCAPVQQIAQTQAKLSTLVDESIVLHLISQKNLGIRLWHKLRSWLFAAQTGLKTSNYILGQVELSPERIAVHCPVDQFDLVLYEYWHTHHSTALFQAHDTPTVLDMHDVLWQSYDHQLQRSPYPWLRSLRPRLVEAYGRQEESAWAKYDALIAISVGEAAYAQQAVPDKTIFIAPMGIDLDHWAYQWSPTIPPRFAFYGSMANKPNRDYVFWCYERILPHIWEQIPEAEFWVIGAKPPSDIQALAGDKRVQVTGYVPDVAEVLATITAVLCPWRGTYGFRSRLIEVMALGVPVVATPDAVYGMGLTAGEGLLLAEQDVALSNYAVSLAQDRAWAQTQSRLARQQMEAKFSFVATYEALAKTLFTFYIEWQQHSEGERVKSS
jgi:glycosyltransferase involved in cell wall biosynthesis